MQMRCPQLEGNLHSLWWREVRGKWAGHWWCMLQDPKYLGSSCYGGGMLLWSSVAGLQHSPLPSSVGQSSSTLHFQAWGPKGWTEENLFSLKTLSVSSSPGWLDVLGAKTFHSWVLASYRPGLHMWTCLIFLYLDIFSAHHEHSLW